MIAKALRALAVLLIAGGCIMAGDYPDWMVGFDSISGARRSVQGAAFAVTGEVLWSSSFENGLNEWIIHPDDVDLIVARCDVSYRGAISARITTEATADDEVALMQFVRPLITGRIGLETFLKPPGYGVSGLQTISVVMYAVNPDWDKGYFAAELQIRNTASDHGAVWLLGALGDYQDTGIRLPGFFIVEGEYFYFLSYHQVKLVVDADDSDPLYMHYVRLVYDGHEYDLSDYMSIRGDAADLPYGIAAGVLMRTNEDAANAVDVDNVTITHNEP
jgi:hypothetical protein